MFLLLYFQETLKLSILFLGFNKIAMGKVRSYLKLNNPVAYELLCGMD